MGSLETDGGLSTVNTERDESGVRDGPDMNTRISPALLLTALTACQAQHREQQPPYLDSITIQDSCQFSLCGPHYTQEFLQGSLPKVGSCSGNCNLLAINLVSNKFTRDWLWSNCASMCNSKYDFETHREYKSRFVCMEKCHKSYQSLSPHHNLARYCAKVSCPSSGHHHQMDCFTDCAEHVHTRVDEVDWKSWGLALAGQCQAEEDKLACADNLIWTKITSSHGVNRTGRLSGSCRETLCEGELACSRLCLNTALALPTHSRNLWLICGQSEQCKNNKTGKIDCVEKCVEQEIEKEKLRQEKIELEKRRLQEQRRQQALLSGATSPSISFRTAITILTVAGSLSF